MKRMVPFAFAALGMLLAGCVSPEEQRAMDQQTCAQYGFAPGTDAFANCMMTTGQKRQDQQAADRRQQEMNSAIAAQAQRDRDAQSAAAAKPTTTYDSTGFPTIEMPKMDMPNMSNCNRSISTAGNAGSMTMTCN
jgi:outer membrane murein-binding lipoprotein Lpp